MFNTTAAIIIALIIYVVAYYTYGKGLEKHVVGASKDRITPARKYNDGVDYVPTNKYVLYGHHFASIAGAGPIVGPAMALGWGWLMPLLWIWFGNVFIGAVHDYLSLMASVRYDGKSTGWMAGELMGRRARFSFILYIWFALILVWAAFGKVIGVLFSACPQSATTSLLLIALAPIVGYVMYRTRGGIKAGSALAVIFLIISFVIGYFFPAAFFPHNVTNNVHAWIIFLFFYSIFAASIPVWFLLQPRDYMNAYILWFGLGFGGIALIIAWKLFQLPAITNFAAPVIAGVASPFWPTVPLVIACGALSGFHSLVSSGTSAKQLDNELSGLFIGYGGMFTEGFLSVIVLTSMAGFWIIAMKNWGSAAVANLIPALKQNFAQAYVKVILKKIPHLNVLTLFTHSYGWAANYAYHVPVKPIIIFATVWVVSFCLTTLDTSTRIGRYAWQELLEPLKKRHEGVYQVIANKWSASIILAGIGAILAWGGAYTTIWPAFSGMNQLLASLALMTVSLWVIKVQRAKKGWRAGVLAATWFLWITVTVAMFWYEAAVVPHLIAIGHQLIAAGKASLGYSKIVTAYTVGTMLGICLFLNFMLMFDWLRVIRKREEAKAPA